MSERDAEDPRRVDSRHPGLRPPWRSRCRQVSDERLDVVFTAIPDVDPVAVSPRPATPTPAPAPAPAPAPTRDLPGSVRPVDAETAAAIVVLAITHGAAWPEMTTGAPRLSVDEIVAAAEAEVARVDDENESGS